jgi:hypothetical protein
MAIFLGVLKVRDFSHGMFFNPKQNRHPEQPGTNDPAPHPKKMRGIFLPPALTGNPV